jgi:hypothetical protein
MNTADAKRTCRQWPLVVGVTASLSAIRDDRDAS